MTNPSIFSENYIEIVHERFIIDLMYARKDNITGCDAYIQIGFGNRAFVHVELWEKLKNIIPYLEKNDLYMKICDAYRPPIAHEMMKEIIPIPNFFAASPEKSPHCRAIAVDVCLCDAKKQELKYPTKVDAYTPYYSEQVQAGNMSEFQEYLKKAAHSYHEKGIEEEIENRETLKNLMESAGLKSLEHEWWHYNLVDREFYEQYPMVEFSK